MAKAELEKVFNVGLPWVKKAIKDYGSYPKFVKGCSRVEVKSESETEAVVSYKVDLIKEVEYVLKHEEDPSGNLRWKLVSSAFLKMNQGGWKLEAMGENSTKVHYEIEIEFSFMAPGFIVKKLVQSSLPEFLGSMEKHAIEIQKKGGGQ